MIDNELFERVVREVLRRLRAMETTEVSIRTLADIGQPSVAKTLEINQRVVALATIKDRLSGVEMVVVRPDAVVTPAVRDELRDRGVALSRDTINKS